MPVGLGVGLALTEEVEVTPEQNKVYEVLKAIGVDAESIITRVEAEKITYRWTESSAVRNKHLILDYRGFLTVRYRK